MLTYNTQLEKLKLPEYGRNIQKMLAHCMSLDDREERNQCARTIIKCMKVLFPELSNGNDDEVKLWEHLRIMSDFKLDVDYPENCDLDNTALFETPRKVSYGINQMRFRHYGVQLERMIDVASEMEEGEERDCLVEYIANQMKKSLIAATSDGVDDSKVFDDLANMSRGRIRLTPEILTLHDFIVPAQPANGKRKKKK